jgi:PhzF family phenazine biosynthesis protein
MRNRAFKQVDVFTSQAYLGNALAVVLDGEGLSDADMQRFTCWTNLSETTFLLPPTEATADYRVRIFTPGGELPFAGHPTLGSCHAWLEAGG